MLRPAADWGLEGALNSEGGEEWCDDAVADGGRTGGVGARLAEAGTAGGGIVGEVMVVLGGEPVLRLLLDVSTSSSDRSRFNPEPPAGGEGALTGANKDGRAA